MEYIIHRLLAVNKNKQVLVYLCRTENLLIFH